VNRFDNKIAVILGGGADGPRHDDGSLPMGNGRAISIRLADEGARVAVVDRNIELAQETLLECGNNGIALQADLSIPAECKSLVASIEQQLGEIDIVVANAATSSSLSLIDQTIEDWENSMLVNVQGHWLVAQAALPKMLIRKSGAFVFVGSTAGALSSGRSLSYEASKAAQMAVMRHIAVRFASKGVRSNAVVLGVIDSAMVRREFGYSKASLDARDGVSPMGRQGRPDEVAGAAAFLASDDASYVNGHSLVVDGGVSAQWPSLRRQSNIETDEEKHK